MLVGSVQSLLAWLLLINYFNSHSFWFVWSMSHLCLSRRFGWSQKEKAHKILSASSPWYFDLHGICYITWPLCPLLPLLPLSDSANTKTNLCCSLRSILNIQHINNIWRTWDSTTLRNRNMWITAAHSLFHMIEIKRCVVCSNHVWYWFGVTALHYMETVGEKKHNFAIEMLI